MESPLLDTHIWIWWLHGEATLKAKNRQKLDKLCEEGELPYLSDMSLWEVQMLHSKGRLPLKVSFEDWLKSACRSVRLLRLSPEVILKLNEIPGTFHGDPADRLIVATSMAHQLSLSTEDGKIIQSRLVSIWNA